MDLETRPQLKNLSAKPGSYPFLLASLSSPSHDRHSASIAESATDSSDRRILVTTSAIRCRTSRHMDNKPGGRVDWTSVHRVRGEFSQASAVVGQRSNRRIWLGPDLFGVQVSDSYHHQSSGALDDQAQSSVEAIRRTPRGAGWRLHPQHQPVVWSRTR